MEYRPRNRNKRAAPRALMELFRREPKSWAGWFYWQKRLSKIDDVGENW